MKKIVYLFVSLLSIGYQSSAQKNGFDLKSILREKQNQSFYLHDSLSSNIINEIKKQIDVGYMARHTTYSATGKVVMDTIKFQKSELNYIHKMLDSKWKKSDLKKFGITDFEILQNGKTMNGPYYGISVFEMSKPIFFRKNTLCLFYFHKRGIGGQFSLYSKVNGEWKEWWLIFSTSG